MDKYNPGEIEKKWQERWEEEKLYQTKDFSEKKKFFLLVEFPYPSGAGLHVGHVRSWGAMDTYARLMRMHRFEVLYPMGWDAFGLPAENYALKMGVHPSKVVPENITTFKRQCQSLGLSFDWSREIDTTDPKYYKWTQWIFVQLFKRGLASKVETQVNWCPFCKTTLANEEVNADGTHERCGNKTGKKTQKQWVVKITKYADRLIEDLKLVDFSPSIAMQQVNWIGKKRGWKIKFDDIEVFTTRPDTLNGVTFLAVAAKEAGNGKQESREKIGKFTGKYVINPVTKKKIPVWEANYVEQSYGTGAIMGVPAHDERDRQFAIKYGIDIVENEPDESLKRFGEESVNYHLRDWIFSRQHYWGEPIPMVDCPKCGWVAVSEEQLPVELPYVERYEPSGTGESPLANIKEWVNTVCPKCGGPARRETDTMPNWAGSNWYFIRYLDRENDRELASPKKMKYWLPVDLYQGGFEHTTLHLLYSRFIYKFLFDLGVVPTAEPYVKRRSHGIVLGSDGRKMSKSYGNVINPDEIVGKYGADTLRLYEMFIGPFDQTVAWNQEGVEGVWRFLNRVWKLGLGEMEEKSTAEVKKRAMKLARRIKGDVETLKFNTVVAAFMEFANWWQENQGEVGRDVAREFCKVLAPVAPHLAEEMWERLGGKFSVHQQTWPEYDPELVVEEKATIVVQVNGKMRDRLSYSAEASKDKELVEQEVLRSEKVKKYIEGKKYKTVFVPGKVLNFVIE